MVKSWWLRFVALLASLVIISGGAAADEASAAGVLESLKQSYDELPETGKFVTGAAVGFTSTRFAVNKVVGVIKLAGATFLASEALKYAGALDYVPDEAEEQYSKVKNSFVNVVDGFRVQVRRRLNPQTMRDTFNDAVTKDRMTTFGVATGCFLGCIF